MAVPGPTELMRPVLEAHQAGDELRLEDIAERVAEAIGVSEEERLERQPSGDKTFVQRIGWARHDLLQLGLLDRADGNRSRITDKGSDLAASGAAVPSPPSDWAQKPVSRESVLKAIAEFERDGRDVVLRRHQFRRALDYVVVHNGREFDSKALYGIAYGIEYPYEEPIRNRGLQGGLGVVRRLEGLGFEVQSKRRQVTRPAWIFQANPAYYDIDGAVRSLPEMNWPVSQYQNRIRQGDRVYLWRSGAEAGVIAIGEILTNPESMPAQEGPEFIRDEAKFAGPKRRVRLRIDHVFAEPLRRDSLKEHPVLGGLGIIKFPNATNYEVTVQQEESLRQLLEGEPPGPNLAGDQGPGTRSLAVDEVREAALTRGLMLEDEVYASAVAALNSGKHVIFTGPPGTAKTTLAQAIAEVATAAGHSSGYLLTTATADWTTYETIGGLRPVEAQTLEFEEGHFLAAIRARKWLVIDELNRSNFDRAFGQLFTVLSGQPVVLPYRRPGQSKHLALVPADAHVPEADVDALRIPREWRVISTMNVFDKSLLFEMSYALMRRFAFVEVPSPRPEAFRRLIARWAEGSAEAAVTAEKLLAARDVKDIGPAVYRDIARYARHRLDGGGVDPGQLVYEAFYSYLLPQFEGIDDEAGEALFKLISAQVGRDRQERLRSTLRAVLGLELARPGGPVESEPDGPADT
jgi:MoxR-like ATPase